MDEFKLRFRVLIEKLLDLAFSWIFIPIGLKSRRMAFYFSFVDVVAEWASLLLVRTR